MRATILPIAVAVVLFLASSPARPQAPSPSVRVYASVLSSGKFIVGAPNAGTGVFYQSPQDDTVWTHTGPERIRANACAVDPRSRGSTLYIASGNGVIRTTDGGSSWRLLTDWRVTEVLGISLDPHDRRGIVIATAHGLFRSADGGENWVHADSGRTFPFFTQAVMHDPEKPGVLLCAAEDGLYESVDGAVSWNRTNCPARRIRALARHPLRPDIIAAGTEDDGLFLSTDRGTSWRQCAIAPDCRTVYAVAFAPGTEQTLYVGGFESGVYASTDLGRTWESRSDGLTVRTVHALMPMPDQPRHLYAGTIWGGVFRSRDAGRSWEYAGLMDSQVVSFTVVVSP
ncbi:MAG: hypothetical protein QHI48_09785 [Bacteroidota bacterium]|nr:hypothetical protein [Bacteroidota bacterium]